MSDPHEYSDDPLIASVMRTEERGGSMFSRTTVTVITLIIIISLLLSLIAPIFFSRPTPKEKDGDVHAASDMWHVVTPFDGSPAPFDFVHQKQAASAQDASLHPYSLTPPLPVRAKHLHTKCQFKSAF